MKIRMLVDKIKADFLTPTKVQLEIELSRVPMNISYNQALSLFRNMINQKHPPQMGAVNNHVRRNVNEVSSGRGGRSGRGGGGRGGRGGHQSGRGGRGPRQTRTNSRIISLTDGQQIEYDASFSFPRHIYLKMKPEDKETMRRERQQYNERQRNRTEIQELRSQVQELGRTVSVESPPTDSISVSQRSQVSQLTTNNNNTIMGGRSEQAQNRQSRSIATLATTQWRMQATYNVNVLSPLANTFAKNECDTNADTCCLGQNFIVLNYTFAQLMFTPTTL
jgi:hypothetical protein